MMETAKRQALTLIQNLPDDSTPVQAVQVVQPLTNYCGPFKPSQLFSSVLDRTKESY
jgi:hypothetical protein